MNLLHTPTTKLLPRKRFTLAEDRLRCSPQARVLEYVAKHWDEAEREVESWKYVTASAIAIPAKRRVQTAPLRVWLPKSLASSRRDVQFIVRTCPHDTMFNPFLFEILKIWTRPTAFLAMLAAFQGQGNSYIVRMKEQCDLWSMFRIREIRTRLVDISTWVQLFKKPDLQHDLCCDIESRILHCNLPFPDHRVLYVKPATNQQLAQAPKDLQSIRVHARLIQSLKRLDDDFLFVYFAVNAMFATSSRLLHEELLRCSVLVAASYLNWYTTKLRVNEIGHTQQTMALVSEEIARQSFQLINLNTVQHLTYWSNVPRCFLARVFVYRDAPLCPLFHDEFRKRVNRLFSHTNPL